MERRENVKNTKVYIGILLAAMGIMTLTCAGAGEALYPAVDGKLWGYINSENQWVIPPSSADRPDYAYGDVRLYNWLTEEWTDARGNRYTQEEMMDPARWGITEINGQPVWRCSSERFGDNWLVACYVEGANRQRNTPMGYVLMDEDLHRLSDDIYLEFYMAEDKRHAIVTLEENAQSGCLIDEGGTILRKGLPLGCLSADGRVVSRRKDWETLYFDAYDGTQLDERKAAEIHAENCPEGLWPCEITISDQQAAQETGNMDWSSPGLSDSNTRTYFVYVDGEGNIAKYLGLFQEAGEFANGYAAVKTEDGQRVIINTEGKVILEDVSIVNGHWYGAPDMNDGWAAMIVFGQGKMVREGCNYFNAEGRTLYPEHCLYSAEPFFEGRALIGVLMEDYSLVYAQIDPEGNVVWAEDGVDVKKLQMQLDQGSCSCIADMTAEDAQELLRGEWVCQGGGQHLTEIRKEDGTWSVPLKDDGTWSIRRTMPEDYGYSGYDFVFVEIYHDENGNEKAVEMELTIWHRDCFTISFGEGSSRYARQASRADERWWYWQPEEGENEN